MKEEKKQQKIFALLTDFGLQDTYVAEMKAVLLSLCPEALIVDISHQVKAFSIRQGLFFLLKSYSYFPKETVFIAVVDPGVGTDREIIAVRFQDYWFIAPNNGLLSAFINEGECYEADLDLFQSVSATFHGRDIFAPLAVNILESDDLKMFLKPFDSKNICYIDYSPLKTETDLKGMIFSEDLFGNMATNLYNQYFDEIEYLHIISDQKYKVKKKVHTFSDLKTGEIGFLKGSHQFIEIAAKKQKVRDLLNIKTDFEAIQIEGVRHGRE